ncbi:MAG: aldehyde ferredoxin oxidoreductase family protein [Candidatus Nezhaarchaeota archaeon]|nr:aldehyde ferredoxin oxidoreductase family protein [Candidatus Nezhaarchaeota archaeon]
MAKLGGYAGQLLHIDLTKVLIKKLPLSKEACELFIGGRGRDAKVIFDHVPPEVDPLSVDNVLCLSTGPITGLLGPTTGRVNVAAKSPLTGIYGNSNAGAHWGAELKYAGYDGVIITGKASKPVYIYIEDDLVEVRDASHLWGKGTYETTSILQRDHRGYDTKVATIGQAAENGVLYGSVIFDYWDAAGRAGMGTVMASKNLKAIAVTGSGGLTVADPKRYAEVVREAWQAVLSDPGFQTQEHASQGTLVVMGLGNAQGWLPTRNFRETVFELADEVSGEAFRDRFSTRPAPIPAGRACLSCPNRCKRFGRITSGKYAGTKGNIEFEGAAAFGPKCGVGDLEAVFHAYMLANDYGVDCITCGNTIALLMELHEEGVLSHEELEGLDLHFGNADAMIEMIHRIAMRKGWLGEVGGLGEELAAKRIGRGAENYVTTIKGLGTIGTDPRVAKGFGFGFAVASRGSDHLRAHPVFEMLKYPPGVAEELFGASEAGELSKYGGKVRLVFFHENMAAVTDSMGTCRFMHASFYAEYPIPELLAKHLKRKGPVYSIKYHEWLSAATGLSFTYDSLMKAGQRIVNLERAINVRLGVRREHDTLPKRFLTQPVPTGPFKGAVFGKKELDEMLNEYYDLRGWERETGLPYRETLVELGLPDVADDLEKRGLAAIKIKAPRPQ